MDKDNDFLKKLELDSAAVRSNVSNYKELIEQKKRLNHSDFRSILIEVDVSNYHPYSLKIRPATRRIIENMIRVDINNQVTKLRKQLK